MNMPRRHELEESLAELVGEDGTAASGEDPISEDDAAEILSMMIKKRKDLPRP